MTQTLPNLFASKFIARPDAKAHQLPDGKWHVHTDTGKRDGKRIPWRRADLEAHIEGRDTFGHYMLSAESKCKLFAFDIDLEKFGSIPSLSISQCEDEVSWQESFIQIDKESPADLRELWLNRKTPGRDFMKLQFKMMAHKLLKAITEELGLPCAAAYSGGKGVHVYGFTGLIEAAEVREGAQIVLDSIGEFKPLRGENFFKHTNEDPVDGFPNLSIEVFPKQDNLDGKDLGNLMRLPLGKNHKGPKEPTFFIDMTTPIGQMVPMDSVTALTIENPWVPF